MNAVDNQTIPMRWDDAHAATLTEAQLLLYRSNLLGADKRITNFGGGNTSAKIALPDPLTGETVEVLWVKGSGGDLGSMTLDGFSTLYMDKLQALKQRYRGLVYEDEMVDYLPHCTFNLNPRAPSIDTPLHAYIPHRHVDHMHPDAVIAIAATKRSRALTEAVYGGELGWLAWQRPGYDLGLALEQLARKHPHLKGVVLEGHGLFTWGETSKECYENTLRVIRRAGGFALRDTRGLPGLPVEQPIGETQARMALVARGLGERARGESAWAIAHRLVVERDRRLVPLAVASPELLLELEASAPAHGSLAVISEGRGDTRTTP